MDDLIDRLRIRADIRRNATGRKSVEEGKPDRLALLLDEAAEAIQMSLRDNPGYITFNPEDIWEAHPIHSVEDWILEVQCEVTRQGYIGWVNSKIEEALNE